jgi:hypothetical protein
MTNESIPVLFRRDGEDITAVFPTLDEGGGLVACYAHVGQHSACSRGWYNTTKAATPQQYADLKRELESAPYRYRLRVIKRWPRL